MNHNDFMLNVLDHIASELGEFPEEKILRLTLAHNRTAELDPDLAVQIIQMVAPRFRCDITQAMSRHNVTALSKEVSVILIRFGRAHSRKCLSCDNVRGAVVMFNRFANTYFAKKMLGYIPHIPFRDQSFFLDDADDTAEPAGSSHGLTAAQIRQNVSRWNITGGTES